MTAGTARRALPRWLWRYVYSFEAMIDDAVDAFARSLPPAARVLDAGAGEGRFRACFAAQRYCGVDLAVGDARWDYSRLDAMADLVALPFADASFDAALNVVTLEHLPEPALAMAELSRVLKSGGRLLIVAPQEWEVHQSPHDFFRYTRHGLERLLTRAGFAIVQMEPAGGLFQLLGRRALTAARLAWWLAPVLIPLGLLLPLCDSLDHEKHSTLGYRCIARKL
jgi:SAM-dependent methyltransferase